jgi:environmental stress-induced protein Ves
VTTLTSASAPLCFDGEQPVQCTLLDGPTQDFNLMLRRDRATARMERVNSDLSVLINTMKTVAVYAIQTGARVHFDDEVLDLPAHTLAWRTCPAGTRLRIEGEQVLWMEINT